MAKTILATSAAVLALATAASAQPVVDGPYSDHAVLQRGAPVVLTGTATGASVTVTLGATSAMTAPVGVDGRWRAELPALEAGGPHALSVTDEDGETRFEDILVGDVWLCSGQSNMAFSVAAAAPPNEDIGPPSERMRFLTIPTVSSVAPRDTLPDGAAWSIASAETASRFSAVCYFAARAFRGNDDETPIGLINASWGGAQIEAFLPAERLAAAGDFETPLALLELYRDDPAAAMAAFGEPWQAWWRAAYDGTEPWTEDGSGDDWNDAPDEMVDWKSYDDPETQGHLGMVWYAKTFTLTDEQAAHGGRLALGMFDDVDATWLNGGFLGSTHSWSDPRVYDVRAEQLHAGQNTIVINVLNTYGPGGMTGPADEVALHLENGERAPLAGGWRYDVVPETATGVPGAPWGDVNGHTTIHNAMIAPLGDIPLAAAIWYQGESNVDHAASYESLLTELIAGWRARFGSDLPVAVVQMPNFGAAPNEPVESGWADIREAERRVAVADDRTGLVVTIDVGDPTNLHPSDKWSVGRRAALVLRGLSGAQEIFTDGVSPTGARRSDDGMVVEMPTDRLTTIRDTALSPFELCDADGACAWADARLDGDTIVVASDAARAPAEVRYCWGDAPVCTLATMDGSPVSPFRLTVD